MLYVADSLQWQRTQYSSLEPSLILPTSYTDKLSDRETQDGIV